VGGFPRGQYQPQGRSGAIALTFIQTGDLHLGTSFAAAGLGPETARQRRSDLRRCLELIARQVADQKAQLLLIAGDLFDHRHASRPLAREASEILAGLHPVPVFIAPGNHDPVVPDSPYLTHAWPGNVHVFTEETPSSVSLPDLGVTVSGLGWRRHEVPRSPLGRFTCPKDGNLQLLVVHADLDPPAGRSPYLPLTTAELARVGADYVALGHIHRHATIADRDPAGGAGRVLAAYAGSPEPLDFSETGIHGIIRGRLEAGRAEVTLLPLATRAYHRCRVVLDGEDDARAIAAVIREQVRDGDRSRDLYRVELQGQLAAEATLDLEDVYSELTGEFYCLDLRDGTRPAYDVAELAREWVNTAVGYYIRTFEERFGPLWETEEAAAREEDATGQDRAETPPAPVDDAPQSERQAAQRALHYGLQALIHGQVMRR